MDGTAEEHLRIGALECTHFSPRLSPAARALSFLPSPKALAPALTQQHHSQQLPVLFSYMTYIYLEHQAIHQARINLISDNVPSRSCR